MTDETPTTQDTSTLPAKVKAALKPVPTPAIEHAQKIRDSIIFKPISGNYFEGRKLASGDDVTPCAIINHISEGTELLFDWFNSSGRADPSSAHFAIDRSGVIEQYVILENAAWGNGNINHPNGAWIPWVDDCIKRNLNPNLFTVSIEHIALSGQGFTSEQINASIDLQWYLCYGHNLLSDYKLAIQPVRSQIMRHSDLDTVTRSNCPGALFPLQSVIDGVVRLQDELSEQE